MSDDARQLRDDVRRIAWLLEQIDPSDDTAHTMTIGARIGREMLEAEYRESAPADAQDSMTEGEKMAKKRRSPIILCGGSNGRCVVYGYVDRDPVPGEPVEMFDARMVLKWDVACGGLFGLAKRGPNADTRLTDACDRTVQTEWKQWLTVAASTAMDEWPEYKG